MDIDYKGYSLTALNVVRTTMHDADDGNTNNNKTRDWMSRRPSRCSPCHERVLTPSRSWLQLNHGRRRGIDVSDGHAHMSSVIAYSQADDQVV